MTFYEAFLMRALAGAVYFDIVERLSWDLVGEFSLSPP